jgi:hypothetical protein
MEQKRLLFLTGLKSSMEQKRLLFLTGTITAGTRARDLIVSSQNI